MLQRFRIDLTGIEGDGKFPCPSCGILISPDDYSETTYNILNVNTKADGTLEEALIKCGRCGSIISLEGFDKLQELDSMDEFSRIDTIFNVRMELKVK